MSLPRTGIIFHGVGVPRRALGPGEGRFWVSEQQLRDLLSHVRDLPRSRSVYISFDDGNSSDLDIALPILEEMGLSADFFVLTGRIGQRGSLDVAGIRALKDAGMGIGSHGVDHLNWRNLDPQRLASELGDSRAQLEDICGEPVVSAAVPFGRYNGHVLKALSAAGYDYVYTDDGGRFRPSENVRARTNVRATTTAQEFADLVAGRETLLQWGRRTANRLRKRFM